MRGDIRPELTARELEVLKLIARGLDCKGIAEHLRLSYNTAKHHMTSVKAKLGANTAAHAVAIAMIRKLI